MILSPVNNSVYINLNVSRHSLHHLNIYAQQVASRYHSYISHAWQHTSFSRKWTVSLLVGSGLLILIGIIHIARKRWGSERPYNSVFNQASDNQLIIQEPRKAIYLTQLERQYDSLQKSLQGIQDADLQLDVYKFANHMYYHAKTLMEEQEDVSTYEMIAENIDLEFCNLKFEIEQLLNLPSSFQLSLEVKPNEGAIKWQKELCRMLFDQTTLKGPFQALLEGGAKADYINKKFYTLNGGTVFHHIAKLDRYTEFATILLKNKACDVSLQDYWGNTGLMWSVANASNSMAMVIMKEGGERANLDAQCNGHGNTAMHLIVGKGYTDFSKDGKKLAYSNLQLLQTLLSYKPQVNIQNREGNTPLHLAAARHDTAMIHALLAAGADVRICNNERQTARDLLFMNHKEVSTLLDKTVAVYLLDEKDYQGKLAACLQLL